MTPWGVYVHVPWCRRRCPYCAFYVEVDRQTPWAAFTDALLRDLQHWRADFHGSPSTVYFGGGTPSRMPPELVQRVLGAIAPAPGASIELEANPEDIDPDWLQRIQRAGVNRVSVGMQTFHSEHAAKLNRACSVPRAQQTAAWMGRSGLRSWSADLIFALPSQTLAQVEADVEAIVATGAPHMSVYGLTYEAGTAFDRARERGTFAPAHDDLWASMYDSVRERLLSAGLEQYEVSNFAGAGHESAHNTIYWTDRPYMALGPSAHGYTPDGRRYHEISDAARWIAEGPSHRHVERPDPSQAATDALVGHLRSRLGLPLNTWSARYGVTLPASAWQPMVSHGLLNHTGGVIAPTASGFAVVDAITRELAAYL